MEKRFKFFDKNSFLRENAGFAEVVVTTVVVVLAIKRKEAIYLRSHLSKNFETYLLCKHTNPSYQVLQQCLQELLLLIQDLSDTKQRCCQNS